MEKEIEQAEAEVEETEVEAEPDWKAEAEKYKGLAKRWETKYNKQKESKPEEKTETNKPKSDLDYGQKAYLAANGVKGSDEVKLVQEFIEQTGKSLEDVLESKYFKNELKDLRDKKSVEDAIPDGSKRAGTAARNTVEYWLAKGELPPVSETELRRAVVNAKLKKTKTAGMFYNS